MANFILHPQLEKDSVLVTELVLCSVRLINDANYPWLILVPRIANISDIIDLNAAQQQMLWQESALVSRVLKYLINDNINNNNNNNNNNNKNIKNNNNIHNHI